MADRKTYYDVDRERLDKDINDTTGYLNKNKAEARGSAGGMAVSGLTLTASIKLSKDADKKIADINKMIEEEDAKDKPDRKKINDGLKRIKKLKALKVLLKGTKVGSVAGLTASGASFSSGVKKQADLSDRLKKYQDERDKLDATEKRRQEYAAKRKATTESVTLYEAMEIINDYLTESAHYVNGEKVNGTAARIALTKANQEAKNNKSFLSKLTSKEAKYRSDSEKFGKGVSDTIPKLNKAMDDSKKSDDAVSDAEKKYGTKSDEYKKALAKYQLDNAKAGTLYFNKSNRRSELRDLKRDYVDYPGSKEVRTIPGKYLKKQNEVRYANGDEVED